MPKTTQLVLTLQSKPGVLAGISRALADARVNILSLSAAEAAGRGKIRMIVSKRPRPAGAAQGARSLRRGAGVRQEARNKPGRSRVSSRSWRGRG